MEKKIVSFLFFFMHRMTHPAPGPLCVSLGTKRRRRRNFLHRNSVTIQELIASNYQRRLFLFYFSSTHTHTCTNTLERNMPEAALFALGLLLTSVAQSNPALTHVGAPDRQTGLGSSLHRVSGIVLTGFLLVDSTFFTD